MDKMGAQTIMHLFLEMRDKDGSSVRDNDLWYTMITNNVGNVQFCILPNSISSGYRNEMG
jgi:hypothetical protein